MDKKCFWGLSIFSSNWLLKHVPDNLKTQGMCNVVVHKRLCLLEYVPDWIVSQQQLTLWRDHNYYCNDDDLIKWHDGYKKRKTQKAQIKDELMPLPWHPLRWWIVVFLKTRKKR